MSNTIQFGSITFPRNGVLASGILGVTGSSMSRVAKCGAGGITCKSISKERRKGHPTPVIQAYQHGLVNAVGLSSIGVEDTMAELHQVRQNTDAVIIASIFSGNIDEFGETAAAVDPNICDAIEINISCPNVSDEFGLPFCANPQLSGQIVRRVCDNTKLPVIVKLSPNFPNIGILAKTCQDNGASGITAINTVGPGMLIDIHTFRPKVSNKRGGVSGPGILPVAIRCVYDIYNAVNIPIIGMGGVTTAEDAIQMIAAGATVYGVGTGVLYGGMEIFGNINEGIEKYLSEMKMKYEDLIGIAHRNM